MFLILPDTVEPGIVTLESTITTHFVKELRATLKVWINIRNRGDIGLFITLVPNVL